MKNGNEIWDVHGDSRKRYCCPWAEIGKYWPGKEPISLQDSLPCPLKKKKYMLSPDQEVRLVKNYDRGLENTARGRRPRVAFSRPRSQFFTIRTDPQLVNKFFFLNLTNSFRKNTNDLGL